MGATIVVCNDTPDPWHCKVSPDIQTLSKYYSNTAKASSAILLAGLLGAYSPFFVGAKTLTGEAVTKAAVLGFPIDVFNANALTLEIIGFGGYAATVITSAALVTTREIQSRLHQLDFRNVESQQCFEESKLRALRLYQLDCVHMRAIDDSTVHIQRMHVGGIFTWKRNGVKEFKMSDLLKKHPKKESDIVTLREPSQRAVRPVQKNMRKGVQEVLSPLEPVHEKMGQGEKKTLTPQLASTQIIRVR